MTALDCYCYCYQPGASAREVPLVAKPAMQPEMNHSAGVGSLNFLLGLTRVGTERLEIAADAVTITAGALVPQRQIDDYEKKLLPLVRKAARQWAPQTTASCLALLLPAATLAAAVAAERPWRQLQQH